MKDYSHAYYALKIWQKFEDSGFILSNRKKRRMNKNFHYFVHGNHVNDIDMVYAQTFPEDGIKGDDFSKNIDNFMLYLIHFYNHATDDQITQKVQTIGKGVKRPNLLIKKSYKKNPVSMPMFLFALGNMAHEHAPYSIGDKVIEYESQRVERDATLEDVIESGNHYSMDRGWHDTVDQLALSSVDMIAKLGSIERDENLGLINMVKHIAMEVALDEHLIQTGIVPKLKSMRNLYKHEFCYHFADFMGVEYQKALQSWTRYFEHSHFRSDDSRLKKIMNFLFKRKSQELNVAYWGEKGVLEQDEFQTALNFSICLTNRFIHLDFGKPHLQKSQAIFFDENESELIYSQIEKDQPTIKTKQHFDLVCDKTSNYLTNLLYFIANKKLDSAREFIAAR